MARTKTPSRIGIQPIFLIILLGVVALFVSHMNNSTAAEEMEISKTAVSEEWDKIKSEDELQRALEEKERLEKEAEEEANLPPPEPVYSGDVKFYLGEVNARRRGDDYAVVDSLEYSIVNDVPFEKELTLSFYFYDDDDDPLLRNKPRAQFKKVTLAPGEQYDGREPVHVGFNQLDTDKTLKFRIKDELDGIVYDEVEVQNYAYLEEQEIWDELSGIEIVPFNIGFEKRDENFGVVRNMSLSVQNNLAYPQDLEISVYMYDDNDESIMRNEVYRTIEFNELLPGEEQTKSFQLRISLNELDMLKTMRFKATNTAKVIIADVEYQKDFSDD